jgi:hydrogenase maturation protease
MARRTLILGWGDREVTRALEMLKTDAPDVDVLNGGEMAPHLLPHLERHHEVLLIGTAAMGGPAGSVYRFRGADLERFRPLEHLHEAARELDLHERQPHEFAVIIAEPGKGAAEALAEAAGRQLHQWRGAGKAMAARAGR